MFGQRKKKVRRAFLNYILFDLRHIEGCELSHNMKLKLRKVMFINLVFRMLLIIYLLRDGTQEKRKDNKPLQYWLDPVSERVFLIFINGLQADFLKQNSTPFLKKVIENFGSFAVARGGSLETNLQGLWAFLTGRYTPIFPLSLLSTYCEDSILDYVPYKCGVGKIPEELSMSCFVPDSYPLETSSLFSKLLVGRKYSTTLILMNFDLDPILTKDYKARLRKIDEDIKFLAEVVGRAYVDNKTSYIVTSGRGSPVEGSVSTDSPVVAWGSGIAATDEVTFLEKGDVTALLCVLLGINFPTKSFGIIPENMMKLKQNYEYDLNLYTIKHFEEVLGLVDRKNFLIESADLQMEQLTTRLDQILLYIRHAKMMRTMQNGGLLILLLFLWAINLILVASSGYAHFSLGLKSALFLLLVIGIALLYCFFQSDLVIMLTLTVFWTSQNVDRVCYFFSRKFLVVFVTVGFTFVALTVVGVAGSKIAIRVFLVPVVLWPVFKGTHKRLNRFVLLTRLLTGIVLGALPHSKTFGEMPDNTFLTIVSFLFLINFYFLLFLFKRRVDDYLKINFLVIFLTMLSYRVPTEYSSHRDALRCLLLAFSFFVVFFVSGSLLSRFLKVFLSLFIPVFMLSVKVESVFYMAMVFHLFTWIFIEYHNKNVIEYHFFPSSVFSILPKPVLKTVRFSEENIRHIAFFLIYCYTSYFAIGHYPDLHSHDLYVVPTFIYDHPKLVSYFLGGFKFFLPFFLVTASFMTICGLKEMDFSQMIAASVGLSDIIGCYLVFSSQFFNTLCQRTAFPVRFTYFTILQFATVSVILSSFALEFLLMSSETLFQKIYYRKTVMEQSV